MTARRTVPLGLAACALVAAAPAWSHPVEAPGEYEYAQPAPAEPPVVYQPGEVVQDVPGDHGPHGDHVARHDADHHADSPVQPDHDHHGDVPVQPERYHHAMPGHGYPGYAAPPQPGYGPGYGYGYGAPVHMTYVPVLVMVPQRAVIRETVTEEWVEGSARPARRTIERHPPQPAATKVKRIRK